MSKVVFKSEKSYMQVSHEHLFHCGAITLPTVAGSPCIVDYDKCREMGIPAPEKFGSGYFFCEGTDHNLLTLETDEEITAMREYAKTTDRRVVELDEGGNEPADPEGIPFISKTTHFVLTPAMYKGVSTMEGKIFRFNMGTDRNMYITNDPEEISIIRNYAKSPKNGITDSTYKKPSFD